MSISNSTKPELPFPWVVWNLSHSCQYFATALISKGLFRKNELTLTYPIPLLLLQLGLAIILSATMRYFLKPLKQPRFVADMLTGILLGPSMFKLVGLGELYESLHTINQSTLMGFLEIFSLTTFSFIVGVRTDVSVIKSSGKLSWMIGVISFLTPLALCYGAMNIMNNDPDMNQQWIATLTSSTSFQVTSLLLEDIKLLNSEIGRLAMSSSLISSCSSWTFQMTKSFLFQASAFQYNSITYLKSEVCRLLLIITVVFVLRPFTFRMMKKIPEGGSMKESQFTVIFMMYLMTCFTFEYLGYKAYFGAMILGLAMPPGPPLGSGLLEKLEILISTVLLPAYIVDAGRYVDVYTINMAAFGRTEVLIMASFLGKLVASVVPLVIYKLPYKDSFTLGLILSSQGLFDIVFYKLFLRFTLINIDIYSIITIMTVLNAAIVTPLICHLYDPSKRYMNYKRRTIQQSIHDSELRIILCIHEEDQVFSLMNLLNASNPTRERPIGAFVLDLMELVGRDHPVLINHQFHKPRSSSSHTRTDRIINAFHHHEISGEGKIKHHHFTSITPYSTMHDDICTLALEKSASLLIIPFHKSESAAVREVTKNVLEKAPCSVGLLIDKRIIMNWRLDSHSKIKFHVCVIFVGGPDSREALAYGIRMVEDQAIRLTVIRLIAEDEFISDLMEAKLDLKVINELRNMNGENQDIEYREVIVKDGAETSQVLLAIDNHYDFMLVGRRLDSDSPLVTGLTDWTYVQELGIIGDILASSDMKVNASILVLQQQSTVEDFMQKS
ncbi:hypothetical protein ACSBR1_013848 [Camellia fascicularis]